jgi:hypothetical protein
VDAVTRTEHVSQLETSGWTRVRGAVPAELCERLVRAMADDLGVPVDDPSSWQRWGATGFGVVPMWGHQAQWDIRQLPDLHRLWADAWGTERLWVSLDKCRFHPPGMAGMQVHWDHNPHDPSSRRIQGVLALTDTHAEQGSFRCVPSLFADPAAWPTAPIRQRWAEEWVPDVSGLEIVHVPARAGDLIMWDYRLPHSNSTNRSDRPRIAFYVEMLTPQDEGERARRVEIWRTGDCRSLWSSRKYRHEVEPWPPARLTPLGERLLGLTPW